MMAMYDQTRDYLQVVQDVLDILVAETEASATIVEGEWLATIVLSKGWRTCSVEVGPCECVLNYNGLIGIGECRYQFINAQVDPSLVQAVKDSL